VCTGKLSPGNRLESRNLRRNRSKTWISTTPFAGFCLEVYRLTAGNHLRPLKYPMISTRRRLGMPLAISLQ
jgi:hypothetical protein